jgi:glycosyltransferase involved in cell wall biosynthesis
MKILLLSTTPGIIDTLVLKLAGRLRNKGVEPVILKYKDVHDYPMGGVKIANFIIVTPSSHYIGGYLREKLQVLEILLNIARVCKNERIGLVHVFTAFPAGPAAALYKELGNMPFVVTVTGKDVEVVREVGYGYRLDPVNAKLISYALSSADFVICPSSYSQRFAIEAGAPWDKSCIIPYAIDVDEQMRHPLSEERESFLRQRFGLGDDRVVLLLCRLIPRKNIHSLVKAFRRVSVEYGRCKLIVAGRGPEEGNLKRLVHELGLTDRVVFAGFVDEGTKYDLMKLADVYVLPSLSDTFAVSALEAMACGTPIVVTDRVGLAGFLKDGEDAIICKSGEGLVDELADGMLKLLTDEGLRARIGERAKERAGEFSYERMSSQVLSVYERVLRNV